MKTRLLTLLLVVITLASCASRPNLNGDQIITAPRPGRGQAWWDAIGNG